MGERLARLDKAIDRLVESAPAHMRAVIEALQALRGVAKLTAVTIVTEVGTLKRFRRPTEMMGYTGFVPSEYSSGGRESKRGGYRRRGLQASGRGLQASGTAGGRCLRSPR
jgi:transposase